MAARWRWLPLQPRLYRSRPRRADHLRRSPTTQRRLLHVSSSTRKRRCARSFEPVRQSFPPVRHTDCGITDQATTDHSDPPHPTPHPPMHAPNTHSPRQSRSECALARHRIHRAHSVQRGRVHGNASHCCATIDVDNGRVPRAARRASRLPFCRSRRDPCGGKRTASLSVSVSVGVTDGNGMSNRPADRPRPSPETRVASLRIRVGRVASDIDAVADGVIRPRFVAVGLSFSRGTTASGVPTASRSPIVRSGSCHRLNAVLYGLV